MKTYIIFLQSHGDKMHQATCDAASVDFDGLWIVFLDASGNEKARFHNERISGYTVSSSD